MLRKAKVVFYTMNSGFPVVVVVAIFKMMLIVVVVVIFLGEELPLSSFRFVYLQFSVSCCCCCYCWCCSLVRSSTLLLLLTITCLPMAYCDRCWASKRCWFVSLVMSLFENSWSIDWLIEVFRIKSLCFGHDWSIVGWKRDKPRFECP